MQLPQRHKDAKVRKEHNINELPWRVFVPLRGEKPE